MVELALLCFCVEAVFQESLEYETDMVDVFLQCSGEHQDVVQVYEDVVVYDVTEDIITEGLEDRGSIHQPEWHHQVLIVPMRRVKCCLPLISLLYLDQVVSVPEVQLRKEARLLQRGEGRGDEWDGIAVFDRDDIESAVIDAGPEGSILLDDEEEAGTCRG